MVKSIHSGPPPSPVKLERKLLLQGEDALSCYWEFLALKVKHLIGCRSDHSHGSKRST